MKKLIKGIIQHKKEMSQDQLENFRKLALEQKPDALFVACSDSRVVPNLFASTDPGDLFVVRNVGNIIPPEKGGSSSGDVSEIAAVEFSTQHLGVKDIIVCGHSECGAMHALLDENTDLPPHLNQWVNHSKPIKETFKENRHKFPKEMSDVNVLSQMNVLQQLEHLKTYSMISERIEKGEVKLHAWWFDIATATVSAYNEGSGSFEELG